MAALSPATMIATIAATTAAAAAYSSARVPPVGHPRVLEVVRRDIISALTPPTADAASAVDSNLDNQVGQVGPTVESAKASADTAKASAPSAAGAKAPSSTTPPYKSDDLEALFQGGAY